jgi:hypothetical protein
MNCLIDNSYSSRSRIAPIYLRCELIFNLDDYGKKESIAIELGGWPIDQSVLEQIDMRF